MKFLYFSITLDNHTFNVRTTKWDSICSYNIDGIYKTSLTFASNIHAHVSYKNVEFKGSVTKQENWNLCLDFNNIVQKKYNKIYFAGVILKENIEKQPIDDSLTIPENILNLYNLLIKKLPELYSVIIDKVEFKKQLCEYLEENYFDVEDFYEIVEYENYDDDDINTEPTIERTIVIDEIIQDTKELFISFHKSELDSINKKMIFTVEEVIKEVPELLEIPKAYVNENIKNYINDHNEELITTDIFYERVDILYEIGNSVYKKYLFSIFMNNLESRINKIISSMKGYVIDKEEMYFYFKHKYNEENIPNDKELTESIKNYIKIHNDFYNLYNKFVNLFGTNDIELVWDEERIQLFEKYEKEEIPVDSQHYAEYEAYKFIMPLYRERIYRKNSNKYKPVIEKLPNFISYATSVYDILFRNHILIEHDNRVIYNENGDIDLAKEELAKLSTN